MEHFFGRRSIPRLVIKRVSLTIFLIILIVLIKVLSFAVVLHIPVPCSSILIILFVIFYFPRLSFSAAIPIQDFVLSLIVPRKRFAGNFDIRLSGKRISDIKPDTGLLIPVTSARRIRSIEEGKHRLGIRGASGQQRGANSGPRLASRWKEPPPIGIQGLLQ
jgi:hypothetical protein